MLTRLTSRHADSAAGRKKKFQNLPQEEKNIKTKAAQAAAGELVGRERKRKRKRQTKLRIGSRQLNWKVMMELRLMKSLRR